MIYHFRKKTELWYMIPYENMLSIYQIVSILCKPIGARIEDLDYFISPGIASVNVDSCMYK
jgi:hypothetical protein